MRAPPHTHKTKDDERTFMIVAWVPAAVVEYDTVGADQVHTLTPRLGGDEHHITSVLLRVEFKNAICAIRHRCATVDT